MFAFHILLVVELYMFSATLMEHQVWRSYRLFLPGGASCLHARQQVSAVH